MDGECAAGADLRDDDAGPVSPRLANRLRLKTREVGSDMRRGARSDLARAALAIDRAAPRGRSARSASRMGVAPRPFGRARARCSASAALWRVALGAAFAQTTQIVALAADAAASTAAPARGTRDAGAATAAATDPTANPAADTDGGALGHEAAHDAGGAPAGACLLYTSPSPRDRG